MCWMDAWYAKGEEMNNQIKWIFLSLGLVILGVGCVSLDNPNNVQVVPPSTADAYSRNQLDKCAPHVYPHRLIYGATGIGSTLMQQGAAIVNTQADFDNYWNSMTATFDSNKVPTNGLKPTVNFDQESVYFLPISISNSCQRFEPYGDQLTTDCYNISIVMYRYTATDNCQAVNEIPVFVYIYPKTTWPIGMQWIDPTPVPTVAAVMTPTPATTATPVTTMPVAMTPTAVPGH